MASVSSSSADPVSVPQMDAADTLALTDLLYLVQGSGLNQDKKCTLEALLTSVIFSNAVATVRDVNGGSWKLFTPADGTIDTGTWAQNCIVQMQAWADAVTNTGSTIKNAVMLILPKWGSTGTPKTSSFTFTHNLTSGEDFSCAVPAGNLLILSFGSDAKVSEYFCLPMSKTDITAAIFKTLSVGGNATVGGKATVGGNISSGGTIKAQEGTGAVPSTSMDKSGISVTDGATNTTEISDDEVSISNSSSSVSLKTTGLAFASAGSTDSGTYSSNMQNESGEYKHVSSGTSSSGVETTTTDTLSFTPVSMIALEVRVVTDLENLSKITYTYRVTVSNDEIEIYTKAVSVTLALNSTTGNYDEVSGTEVTSENTTHLSSSNASFGALTVNGASVFSGNFTASGKLITPIIGSYTADVDLTTYVVDHSMVSGQHLFILNAGTADITVTGKVLSGPSEISKTWTLAVGTVCDFIAVPITSVAPNAIAKLG